MIKIATEFTRIKGILGTDPVVDACVLAAKNKSGDEQALRTSLSTSIGQAESAVRAVTDMIVRDSYGNGSVLSLSPASQDALETANWKLMRLYSANSLVDSLWPPAGITEAACLESARAALSNGHGGIKAGCTAKRNAKMDELEDDNGRAGRAAEQMEGFHT